jgi:hypothetical protein
MSSRIPKSGRQSEIILQLKRKRGRMHQAEPGQMRAPQRGPLRSRPFTSLGRSTHEQMATCSPFAKGAKGIVTIVAIAASSS